MSPINRIIKRLKLNRKLTHAELDNNFQYGNFWETDVAYQEDMVVIYNDKIYRALLTTTPGTFIDGEWEEISKSSSSSSGAGILGVPTSGEYGDDGQLVGEFTGITVGDRVEDAFDKVEKFFHKLVPPPAPNLSTRTLIIPNLWTAKELTTGTSRANITVDPKPIATVSDWFHDGGSGTIQGFIDSSGTPSVALISGSTQAGTYTNSVGSLVLTETEWPIPPASSFWEALGATVQSATNLSANNLLHTYQITHSTTGSTSANFYVDILATPSLVPQSLTASYVSTPKYISGVPSPKVGDKLRSTFRVDHAVSYFYNLTRITRVESVYATGADVPSTPIPTTYDQQFQVTNFDIPVITGQTTENASVTLKAWNARGTVAGDLSNTTMTGSPNVRIDTLSDESNRLKAGIGQFPSIGSSAGQAGNAFDSTVSVATAGNEELQLYFGKYKWPSGNFTLNGPTPGPNYTSVPAGTFNGIRWVLLYVGNTVGDVNSVNLTFTNPLNFGASQIIPNFYMYVRVINGSSSTTGWVDGNVAYSSGNPTNNGDAAYNYGASTVTMRNVTFGTAIKNGQVWVRVGIPSSSTLQFTNITLS